MHDHAKRARTGPRCRGILLATLIALVPACATRDRDPADRKAELLGKIEAAYTERLTTRRPSYVVVTLPGPVRGLEEDKAAEHKIVCRVLRHLQIPYEVRARRELETTFTRASRGRIKEYTTYHLDRDRAERIKGGTLLYLNLAVNQPVAIVRNPITHDYGIKVSLLDDPIQVSTTYRWVRD